MRALSQPFLLYVALTESVAPDPRLQGSRARSSDEDDEAPDVFDAPDGEPTEVFVNPFACSINPLDWREVQVGGAF